MAEFEIQRCLGRGGFGEVYRGVMSRGGGIAMDVAIKVLRPDLDPASQGVQRLRDEGRLLGRLTHPTILRVYDLVVIEGRAALISEYVDGDDLAHVVRTDERPPPKATFEIVAQVAAALDAAWSWPSVTDGQPLNLVHRDIKPDNIRLDPHGVVKLLDFGIAQASSVEREAETSVNIIMGSAQYLAPERMVQQEVGPESDVFALGCTLYEALTGEALFHRKSMRQMYLLMIEETRYWPYIDERLAKLDGVLDHERGRALLRAMIAYKKGERPDAGDVAARCDTISESLKGATLRRWARNHNWPKPDDTESGPLEGRTFTSVLSLPAPEARTLALRAGDDWKLPDPAETLTDPGTRSPALGELSGEAGAEEEKRDFPAPWSGAELVAMKPSEVEDEDDNPTVQLRLTARTLPDGPQPEVELAVTAPATGADEPTVEGITGPDPLADAEEELGEEDVSTGPTDLPAEGAEGPAETTTDGNPLPSAVDTLKPGEPPPFKAAPKAGVEVSNEPAQASEPTQPDAEVPEPAQAMEPAQAPEPVKVSEPAQAPEPAEVSEPAQAAEAAAAEPAQAAEAAEVAAAEPAKTAEAEPAKAAEPVKAAGSTEQPSSDGPSEAKAPADPSATPAPAERLRPDTTDAPVEEDEDEGDSDSALMATDAIDPAAVRALRDKERASRNKPTAMSSKNAPAEAEPPPPAAKSTESAEVAAADDEDYEPQPGDIDLSSAYGGKGSGDVRLRVAPPGKTTAPSPKPRRRGPDTRNRVPVMVFSGTAGMVVGAVVITGIAFVVWLFVG